MEAIIRDGGRQYTVRPGERVEVDWREAEPGSAIEFGEVLLVRPDEGELRVGAPLVDGAKVVGKVVGQAKGPKLTVLSFRRRKNSKRRVGHRQRYIEVEIETISA
ncbi:MAG TPA: 50S ribosomal protein L21 [Planctomycetota bacterium]|nr:50S ribosomal protein L21 [Planctomycetota bacterium]